MVPTRLCNLAEIHIMLGDAPRAIRLGEEALAAARDLDDREDTADILYVLASAYHLVHDDEATVCAATARPWRSTTEGTTPWPWRRRWRRWRRPSSGPGR